MNAVELVAHPSEPVDPKSFFIRVESLLTVEAASSGYDQVTCALNADLTPLSHYFSQNNISSDIRAHTDTVYED